MLKQPGSFPGCHDWMSRYGRVVGVVYLDSSKMFDTVSHNVLEMKLRKYGIGEGIVRWTENWLTGRTQRVVISSTESGWRPVTSTVPRGRCRVQSCLTFSSVAWMKEGTEFTLLLADNKKSG